MKKVLLFLLLFIPIAILLIVNFTAKTTERLLAISVDDVEISSEVVESINVNDSFSLSASVYPINASNKKINWRSDNESVAKVDENGNVSFFECGSVNIIATTEDGLKTKSCYFYVTDTKVHSISVGNKNEMIYVGSHTQLECTTIPYEALNKSLKYKSLNENVALVNQNGYVTAVASGFTKIIVMTNDESVKTEIGVTVRTKLENITLENCVETSLSSYQISYKKFPSNAEIFSSSFISSDENILSVDKNGLVSFNKAGSATVIITINNLVREKIDFTYTAHLPNEIILNNDYNMEKYIGDQPVFLNYEIKPADVQNKKITVFSSNQSVAFVSNNYINFVGAGNCTLKVQTEGVNGVLEKSIFIKVFKTGDILEIDDEIVCGESAFQLQPSIFPLDENCVYTFENLTPEIASINSNGLVTKLNSSFSVAQIKVYAKTNKKILYKLVKVIFTSGKPFDMIVPERMSVFVNKTLQIPLEFMPQKSTSVVSLRSSVENVAIIENGKLRAFTGGKTIVSVTYTNYLNESITKEIEVDVYQPITDVFLNSFESEKNNVYYTAKQQHLLSFDILPNSFVYKEYNISVKSGKAQIFENQIFFNSKGLVEIEFVTEDKSFAKTFKIDYVGVLPIEVKIADVKDSFEVGEIIPFVIKSYFPSDAIAPVLTFDFLNNNPILSGDVVKCQNGELIASNSGEVDLQINFGNLLYKNLHIKVLKPVREIKVFQTEVFLTKDTINLNEFYTLLPLDCSNKKVSFEIDNINNVTLQDSILIFGKSGSVVISICSVENSELKNSLKLTFQAPNSLNNTAISLDLGQKKPFNIESYCSLEHDEVQVIYSKEDIISNSNGYLIAQNLGTCLMSLKFYLNKIEIFVAEINIEVSKFSKQIEITNQGKYNDIFYTSNQTFTLNYNLLPNDCTNKNVNMSLISFVTSESENILPTITNNQISFVSEGHAIVKVLSEDECISQIINVCFTRKIIYAELENFNIELYVGDKKELNFSLIVPYDIELKTLSLKNDSSNFTINSNVLEALSPCKTIVVFNLNSTYSIAINLAIIQPVTSIEIKNDNILTSKSSLFVEYIIYPNTASNKNVVFEKFGENNNFYQIDSSGKLIFLSAGIATIKIYSQSNPEIFKIASFTSTFGYAQIVAVCQKYEVVQNQLFTVSNLQIIPNDLTNISYNLKTFDSLLQIEADNQIRATGVGSSFFAFVYTNCEGVQVEILCEVNILSHVERLGLEYDTSLLYFDKIFTAMNTLLVMPVFYPNNSVDKRFSVIISSDKACYNDETNKIVFEQECEVEISFVATDNFYGEIRKNILIVYTKSIVYASLQNRQQLEEVDSLKWPKKFQLVANQVPKNLSCLYSVKNVTNKDIIEVLNNEIISKNPGSTSFDLYINDFFLGSFTLEVILEIQSISFNSELLYSSKPSISLSVDVFPINATQSDIEFEVISGNAQIIDKTLFFTDYSTATVLAKVKNNPSIYCQADFEYSNKIKAIQFDENLKDFLFTNSNLALEIDTIPEFSSQDNKIIFSSSNPKIANVNEYGVLVSNSTSGSVTITAFLENDKSIFASMTFTVESVITSLVLELDSIDDNCGISGTRVFGTSSYYLDNIDFTNYQMKIKYCNLKIEPGSLAWTSSDPQNAVVDENGIVMFKQPGEYTIHVEPYKQYNSQNPVYDEYKFIVVDGINVFDNDSFYLNKTGLYYNELEVKYGCDIAKNIVLHTDIDYTNVKNNAKLRQDGTLEMMIVYGTIYGNGHMIYFSRPEFVATNEKDKKMCKLSYGASLNNLKIRGKNAVSNVKEKFDDVCVLVAIEADSSIVNCILENARECVKVVANVDISISGCILRNTSNAGILVPNITGSSSIRSDYKVNLYIKDCIFSNNEFSAIYCYPLERDSMIDDVMINIYLLGKVYFYNWTNLDNLDFNLEEKIGIKLDGAVETMLNMIYSKYGKYVYIYKGNHYVCLGLMAFDFKVNVLGKVLIDNISHSTFDVTKISPETNKYEMLSINENILDTLQLTAKTYAVPADNNYSTPLTTYVDDEKTFKKIRQ